MLKDQRFYVGFAVGAGLAYYMFVIRPAKMGGGRGKKGQNQGQG